MRILIVEDEPKLADSLQQMLTSEHYAVDVVHDGRQGFEQAEDEEYDAIILDINLPSMDGIEVCKALRDDQVTTPILMLTARDTVKDRVAGLDVGADDYLVKPFEFEELLARVRAMLRRESVQVQEILTVDTLQLDPKAHTVSRHNKAIEVSAKEYALLEFLIRRANQVVSKSDVIDHVWGSEIDPFSNVVDVYIGYVRKKIDKAFPRQKPLLHTIKGLGYRLGV